MKWFWWFFMAFAIILFGCHNPEHITLKSPEIVKITAITGGDLVLKDGRCIRGVLNCNTAKEAHAKVVNSCNQSKLPRAVL
jgi:hypothetical protein